MPNIFRHATRGKKMKLTAILVVGVTAIVVGAWALSRGSVSIPTAVVERGEFSDALPFHGEVKAPNSVAISAPSGAGDLRL